MPEILHFCAAILGAFLAIPLLVLRSQRSANFWIGMCVLSLSLLSLASSEVYRSHWEWFGLLDWPVACIGPFYHCYVRSMVGVGNGRRQAVHFVPAMVLAAMFFLHGVYYVQFNFTPLIIGCEVLATAYAIGAVLRLQAYRRRLLLNYSSLKNRDLTWLSWLSVLVVLIMVNWVLAAMFHGIWDWLLLMTRIAILYFVGWFGLRHAGVFAPGVDFTRQAQAPRQAAPEAPPESSADESADTRKYARSGMKHATQESIGTRLAERMARQRDFLESDLTLAELAERIGTSPQLLSEYLNATLGQSFFDYVNGLRVAEVQRMMADPAQSPSTLLELAFAAGFNAKSTFNAAFKKISGTTPSQWRRHADIRTAEAVGEEC